MMAQKMVANFRRSLSFPNQHPTASSSSPSSFNSKPPAASYHVRSLSLPCRPSFHPLISQLRDQVNELKSWAAEDSSSPRTAASICDGLNQLKAVQESLDHLLQLPTSRESIYMSSYCGRGLIDKFLDDLLRFLDAYGIFQTLILTLKQHHSAAQVALKRKDYTKLMSLCSKNFNKMAKDFRHLTSSSSSSSSPSLKPSSITTRKSAGRGGPMIMAVVEREEDGGDQIVEVIKDVIEATALVSFALFKGLSVSLSAYRKLPSSGGCLIYFTSISSSNIIPGVKKKKQKNHFNTQQQCYSWKRQLEEGIQEFEDMIISLEGFGKINDDKKAAEDACNNVQHDELKWNICKKMNQVEDCIHGIENGSEKVLRSLFNTRVSLLNLLSALYKL